MSLTKYKQKRTFGETPEPTGGKPHKTRLHFVVQKHAASRLHYDFRLEMEGVLKSWAVPKGPSMKPGDKRLAMMVEDHPYDYKDFEGVIPEGNYGAGTVIVWDRGTYAPVEPARGKAAKEALLLQGLEKGSLKFRLNGERLKGEFILVHTPRRAKNAWLLIKHRDEFAVTDQTELADRSVASGLTLDEVAADPAAPAWQSNRSKRRARPAKPRKSAAEKAKTPSNKSKVATLTGARPAAMPRDVAPMLATLAEHPNDEPGWLYEIKWDGFRALSYLDTTAVEIKSRNNKDFTGKFYPISEALEAWGTRAVVDGEIIVLNRQGYPDFEALQGWRSEADGALVYYLFDLLWYDGYDLTDVPLFQRRKLLKEIVPEPGRIRFSDDFEATGTELMELAAGMGLEGIVAKRADSPYQPGQRTRAWLKLKTVRQQEVVIGGYTRNEGSARPFSALLTGVYENGRLVYTGPVGTGFSQKRQQEILKRLTPLETKRCPFATEPDYNKPSRFRPNPPVASVTWVRPQVVAEVNYRTVSSDGTLRHPSFKGIRDDKEPEEVVREVMTDPGLSMIPPQPDERQTLLNPTDETQVRQVDGHTLKFTNLGKVFWPELGVTKRDMLNYYYQVAPYMLPYMQDRPQTLNRFPNGIEGKSFYQKDVTGKVPEWIATHGYFSEADDRQKHFLVCTHEASLLYMASLGCIEMNPWSSRSQKPDHPDWCIIDLDPDKNTFAQVIEAARVTREVLDALEIPSFPKTSGSTGLHIYIPLGARYTYEDSKEFARAIAKAVHDALPAFTTVERLTSNRQGKMYIDFLQNRPQATVAGPYSLRPRPGAPVSMPLHWDEVRKGLKITDFTIANALARLRETGDLFEGVLGEGVDMDAALKKLR